MLHFYVEFELSYYMLFVSLAMSEILKCVLAMLRAATNLAVARTPALLATV